MSAAFKITPCDFQSIAHLANKAAGDRVSISDTKLTKWFKSTDEDQKVTGCAAAMKVAGCGIRIKGVWVSPSHRKKGIGEAFVDVITRDAEHNCVSFLEAFAYNKAFYEAKGFKTTGVLPNGASKMRKPL
jgi:N-acetylglutamate synthase-like GNAT family acetyltransferase